MPAIVREPTDALTPLDVLVLRDPNKAVGAQAVRLALQLLAARGMIAPASTPQRWWEGGQRQVRVGPSPGDLPPALAVVARAIRGTAPSSDVVVVFTSELIRRLQRAFAVDYGRYLRDHLRLPLVARGLLVVESYRQLWFFTRRRHRFTDAGLRVRARVDRDVAQLASHPQRAARVAASLGALLLLDDALGPHHAALAGAWRMHGAPDVAELVDEEERRMRWSDGIDAWDHVDWGDAFDAIDGVGDAFDAGGGDAGSSGDGGGSDGGSSD